MDKNTKYLFEIRDSYKHIACKLSDFALLFNLQVEKEVMPYAIYTTLNLDE